MRTLLLILTFITLQASGQALFHAHNKVSAAPAGYDPAYTKPLDSYPSYVAYSLRKLRSAYSGPAVRVRRNTDNAETDIGFRPNGNFDSLAFVTFIGAGKGYAVTLYDQSGNGVNATTSDTSQQAEVRPALYNGKAWLYFRKSSGNHYDFTTALFGGTTPDLYMMAAHMSSSWAPLAYGNLVSYWVINPNNRLYVQGGGGTLNPYFYDSQPHPLNMWMEGGVKKALYQEVSYSYTEAATAIPAGTQTLRINGIPGQTGWDFDGWMGDYILYSSDQGSTARAFINSNIKTYYNIP